MTDERRGPLWNAPRCIHCGSTQVKKDNLSDLRQLLNDAEHVEVDDKEEYHRHLVLDWAVRLFDGVITELTDNSEEDMDILTSLVAKAFTEKVHLSLQHKLLRKRFEVEHAQPDHQI